MTQRIDCRREAIVKHGHRFSLIATGFFAITGRLLAAGTLTVDLASLTAGSTTTVSISAGDWQVKVANRIPKKAYNVSTRLTSNLIPVLDASVFGSAKTATDQIVKSADPCQPVTDAITALTGADAESKVPGLRSSLDAAAKAADAVSCADAKQNAADTLALCDYLEPQVFTFKGGQVLEVKVTRSENGKDVTWTVDFQTEERGQFLVSYGFLFIPNPNQQWYSKATDDPHKFTVTKQDSRLKQDFAAAVMFGWLPSSQYASSVVFTPVAGLGFDLSSPVVFAGGGVMFNQNIWLVAGAVASQRPVLNGQYQPNQIISENLSSDQLTSKTYGVSVFAGLSFRFGSKPSGYGGNTPTPAPAPSAPSSSSGSSGGTTPPGPNKKPSGL
jgi:hypothetical protein